MKLRSTLLRRTSVVLAILILTETLMPSIALALTSGPTQPEFHSFQPAGTADMVDLFTGNFNYNIPLLDVGGYPLNISYSSDNRMDDEASWVGLGWTLSPGAINRNMRGLPDDFNGEDKIKKQFNLRDDVTFGIEAGIELEVFGKKVAESQSREGSLGLNLGGGMSYNSRRGFGFSPSANLGPLSSSRSVGELTGNIGLSFSPSSGLGLNGGIGLKHSSSAKRKISSNLNSGYNSRHGIRGLTFQHLQAGEKVGGKFSGSFDFGPFSYTPTSQLPLVNKAVSFDFTAGAEFTGLHNNLNFMGYWNEQSLKIKQEFQAAYGYLHLDKGSEDIDGLLDYNSEINGQLKPNVPHMPLAYGTYDQFSISGQGISGGFHAKRNDVGVFRPAKEKTGGLSGSLGLEFGVGNIAHAGADVTVTESSSVSGEWAPEDNLMKSKLEFISTDGINESTYFKGGSDFTKFDSHIYETTLAADPVQIQPRRRGSETYASSRLVNNQFGYSGTTSLSNSTRASRSQVIDYLTVSERNRGGLDNQEYSYTSGKHLYSVGSFRSAASREFNSVNYLKDHHIGQFNVTQGDGTRYIYGLPVYSITQEAVSFSTIVNDDPESDGEIQYNVGENLVSNNSGKDAYFDKTTTPAYSTAHLLTGLLSPDYVDRTGDGITDDDLGNAIKFNYTQHSNAFRWRSSIGTRSATYHEGLKASSQDNKASYHYGVKEIWYPHSIESRNMIAIFHTTDRDDANGVHGTNGGKNAVVPLKKLSKIELFSKAELSCQENPLPIKTVHFDYVSDQGTEYDLCAGVDNHAQSGGKLTLRKIYFTYADNDRGKLNAYKFDYKNDQDFAKNKMDRWGYYKNNEDALYPSNQDYPYVIQDDEVGLTQNWAGMWNLNKITLPSGAEINVEFESDDYAFVQDKRAAQMMPLVGFADNTTQTVSKDIYTTPGNSFRYMVVRMPDQYGLEEAQKRCIGDMSQLYFNALVELKGESTRERVSGYLNINEGTPFLVNQNQKLLYIPVRFLEDKRNLEVHPIVYASLQKMRLELPELVYPGFNNPQPGLAVLKSLLGLVGELANVFAGFERNSMNKGWAQTINGDEKQSWVRLYSPTYAKLGGGSRVKKITISPSLDGMSTDQLYGQEYSYKDTYKGEEISSGVASYEPGVGGEENSLKTAMPYEEKNTLAPNNEFYSTKPIGEALFPSPVVGYSKVQVKDIANNKVTRTGSGHTIHEFFTAKDFPTIVKNTRIRAVRNPTNPIKNILNVKSSEEYAMTQGFTIEVNDMHGKPKAQSIFDNSSAIISATKYQYAVDDPTAARQHLNNKVKSITSDGVVSVVDMGVDMDMWQEMLEEKSKVFNTGFSGNFDGFFVVFPFGLPTAWPIGRHQETKFRAASTTKLIKRQGILESVVVTENGSTIATNNLAYDDITGGVLLTETQNEFDDPMYSFSYPAHWVYDGMGPAYKNASAIFDNVTIQTSGLITGDAASYLMAGDEVITGDNNIWQIKCTVAARGAGLALIDHNGVTLTDLGQTDIKVIRSGRRNLSETSIGQVTSRDNPMVENAGVTTLTFIDNVDNNDNINVLDANAVTFNDEAKIDCDIVQYNTSDDPECDVATTIDILEETTRNEFHAGLRGNWRPDRNYVFYNNRGNENITADEISNIQNKGQVRDFYVFNELDLWSNGPIDQATNEPRWTKTNEVTQYDSNGNEIENKNALDIASSADFGFQRTLPIAVSNNSLYHEMFSDGFEDYYASDGCAATYEFNRKIDLVQPGVSEFLQQEHAHSGKSAMKIPATQSLEFSIPASLPCPYCPAAQLKGNDNKSSVPGISEYVNDCEDCLPRFFVLTGGKSYHFSMWVATDASIATGLPPENIEIRLTNGGALTTTVPSGPVIEGWQRLSGEFDGGYQDVEILRTSGEMYLDDIRIHPFKSNMNTYAYDPMSLRLMAQLDENNYATFYEYDDEGMLVRVKRETENGIATIQEGRTVLSPNN